MTTVTLDREMFDHSCDVGDLVELISHRALDNKYDEKRLVESEAKKFLGSFFKGGRFESAIVSHIKFSPRISGLALQKFDSLVANGRIEMLNAQSSNTEYGIAETFRKSVRKYLADNHADAEMKEFLKAVRNDQP